MAKNNTRRKPNITITADGKTLAELKLWAGSKGISVNALINEILTKNTFFFKYVAEHDCAITSPAVYGKIIELLPEKTLTELIKANSNEMVESIFAHNNISYNINNMVRFYFETVGIWSGLYSIFKHYTNRNVVNLVFEHKYGIKWSKVLSNVISDLLIKTLGLSPRQTIHPNTIILQVKEK